MYPISTLAQTLLGLSSFARPSSADEVSGFTQLETLPWLPKAYQLHFPKELEARFQDIFHRQSLGLIRLYLLVLCLGYAAFGLLDLWSLPVSQPGVWLIRYGIVCPIVAGSILLSFWSGFLRIWQPLLCFVLSVAGLGVVGIIALSEVEEPGYRLYFMGVSYAILGIYLVRVSLIAATLVSLMVMAAYTDVAIARQDLLQTADGLVILVNNLVFLLFFLFAGLISAYSVEVISRVEFLQRQAIDAERLKTESLLLSLFPRDIARSLRDQVPAIAEEYDAVSVLFADIVNFTALTQTLSPLDLVELLDELFSRFDDLVERSHVEKIKTIGDCYMVAAGVPTPQTDHATVLAQLALDLRDCAARFAEDSGQAIQLRIGLHSGSVVAGVLGRRKWLYDLWGDAVNTASRMEFHCPPGKIQLTRETYNLVRWSFDCEAQGEIEVKGKGRMAVWHLRGRLPQG